MTLRRKLLIALILLLVPLMAADVYYHYSQYITRRSEAFAQYTESARDLARNTELFVARTVAIEKVIGQTLKVSDQQGIISGRADLVSVIGSGSMITNIALADPSGRIVRAYPRSLRSVKIADRPYFRSILHGADWAVSGLLVNRLDHKPGFIVASALRDRSGSLEGVVLTRVDEQHVGRLLAMPTIQPTVLVLADAKGRITYMSGHPDLSYRDRLSRDHYLQARLESPRLIMHADLPSERNVTGALVSIPTLGWSAGAFASRGQILRSVRMATIQDIAIIAAVFVFTIAIGSLLARQLTRSVDGLSAAAEQLGAGKLDARVPSPGVAEFKALASTMNSMAESLQQRDEALHEAYERERRISTAFQECMLPDVPAQIGSIELATAYFPALEEAELGGDFYDVMLLPDGLIGLLIADVSGKGLDAAVHTAMAKYTLEGFVYEDPDPARALDRLSAFLHDNSQTDKFITAFLAIVNPNTGKITYANAGHPQPILRHKDGTIESLRIASGPPLGVSHQPEYTAEGVVLARGDMLFCYTDGVVEARKNRQWFGSEGLESLVASIDCAPSEAVCQIYKSVSDFVEGNLPDDIALIAVRMNPDAP